MSYNDNIANNIAFLARQAIIQNPPTMSIVGRIKSIDSATNLATIQPLDTTLTEIGCIQLTPSNSSINAIPSLGQLVIINMFDQTSGYVAQYGAVSQVTIAPGSTNYSGMCIVQDVTDKLNNLEHTVNALRDMIVDFQNIYNSHTHEVASFGTPSTNLTPTFNDSAPSALTYTQVSDLENPNVTHGNGVPDTAGIAWNLKIQDAEDVISINNTQLQIASENLNAYILKNPGGNTTSYDIAIGVARQNLVNAIAVRDSIVQAGP